jgi:UDP-N-acetylmuramate dehydrogenase
MTDARLVRTLGRLGELREREPMSRHTTFGIGGPADLYLRVQDRAALGRAHAAAADAGVPSFVLGSGSNILVGDRGIRGLVIDNNARAVDAEEAPDDEWLRLRADSGVSFASLARRLCRDGVSGLEWAVGIPGTLGGAVVFNAGAYGGCLSDVLVSIEVAANDGSRQQLPATALVLDYRSSTFTRGLVRDHAILSVELLLRRRDATAILRRIEELDRQRKASQPPGRDAGSIFKNPPDRPAWWYIDQVGLRGARRGDALVSTKHANFFMNVGRASAADVKALMDEAVRRVREQFGIELHPEVALIGEGFGETGGELCSGAQ